jgi:hypothetical protein
MVGAVWRLAGVFPDQFHHSLHIDRLRQHFHNAVRPLDTQVRCPGIATHDNYRYSCQSGMRRNLGQERHSVHDWHRQVKQDQGWRRIRGFYGLERSQPIFRG